MTDEQINRAIAEACGWRQSEQNVSYWHHVLEPFSHILFGNLPKYCTDLNAMHDAEKVLTKEQVREYQCFMYDMACEIHTTHGRWMPYSATARYRAEAFLRTLGKWEEVQK